MRFVSTDGEPARLRPTLSEALAFAAIAVLAFLTLAVAPQDVRGAEVVVAAVAFAVVVVLVLLVVRRDRPSWLDSAGPLLFFLPVALLRDASGGFASGLAPLVMLPILWLALFGTRRDLVAAAVFTVAGFVVPILLVGAPAYPWHDWRRGLLYSAIALLIGPIVQRVVAELIERSAQLQGALSQVDAMMNGATLTSMIATDLDGRITAFSRGSEQMLGFTASEVAASRLHLLDLHVGREVAEVADELGTAAGFAALAHLGDRHAPSRIWRYRRRSGEEFYVRCAITPLRSADGTLTGYLAVSIDATTAVQTRMELEAAEERWRVVMERLTDTTLLVIDENFRIDLVGGGGAMSTGFRQSVGRQFSEFANPENNAVIEDLVTEAVRGRESRTELSSSVTGHVHQVFVTPLPHTNDSRETRQALLLAHDVSDARRRERETAEARDEAETLFEHSPQPIAVVDRAGVLLRVNGAFVGLFERPESELVGVELPHLSSGTDDVLSEHLDELFTGDTGESRTQWRVEADGGVKHLVVSSTSLGSERALVTLVDVSERHEHEQQLAHLADHDPLTGLANRRKFNSELTRHVDFGRRYGPRGALLLLDLDHFKEVNDTLGHAAGDQLIISVATLLGRAVRQTDLVARLGGDEFAVLLQETDRAGAERVAATIVARIREHVATLDGSHRNVTASIGVVVVDDASKSAQDLLADADLTMYDAKDAGRNQYAVLDYMVHGRPRTAARIAWASRLEAALENDDLTLHLQPVLDLKTGEVTGAEALLRLTDGDEVIYPAEFLYVAERTDLIVRIDQWVLDRSIALLARIQRLRPDFDLEVNLSARSIGNPAVEATLRTALLQHRADPRGLILEITETIAVAQVDRARAFAERIQALGCRFALDDFGAGFGSFYYLKHLLFDYVKIDGEFIAQIHRNPADRTIVRSVVDMAHGLGKKVIAEFVGDAAAYAVVQEEGVDLAQGYHIGRPVPVEEFLQRFAAMPA